MYSKHFCMECLNNWDVVPYSPKAHLSCPSCGSLNTRYWRVGDPTDKSEVVFAPSITNLEGTPANGVEDTTITKSTPKSKETEK